MLDRFDLIIEVPEVDSRLSSENLSASARQLLELAVEKQALTARGFHRVLRVARTIANLAQSVTVDWPPLADGLSHNAVAGIGAAQPFDGIPCEGSDIDAGQPPDFTNAGGRGYIDLGQIVANHVNADKSQPAPPEFRPDPRADFLITCCQFAGHCRATNMQV